jgi:hypothetical protein
MRRRQNHIYLCELLSKDDGSRQTVVGYRSQRGAKRWRDQMNLEDEHGFSSADKLGCVAVIKTLEIRP